MNKMMRNSSHSLLVALMLGAFLSGCSSYKPRSEPNAPVYERGSRVSSAWGGLAPGETAGVDSPELATADQYYEPDVSRPVPAATSPTQAPAAETIAYADTTTYQPSRVTPVPAATSSTSMSAATKSLLFKADREQSTGNLTGAASTLERALRIENHPLLWNRLANIRLQQKRYSFASDLASKSNALASGDYALKRNNYEVIAQAKAAMGDSAGAASARAKIGN
ncbi:hypothetical protein BOV88_05995 [Solemya velum gill symbiont]|uniref:Uncharacterized protein n=3 Tax=Solemya velum gill symbiont TaxID=2340 RepID=A0A1T2CT97_SOVGS|nr:hypothetical protein [Solemya velum gill symbiont]OOY35270.1 hypothetical protein BOV88_05995 [Solemya velum gill symbiont]OOY37971.1 hypothetical protein BOV89_04910 [Solemya velum gill symbiont]OOY41494.1 hypothetical protein BOV91_11180 [Solemya velum gill symbiont]OOY44075.1 hypothetical protein BOV92_09630 [Solemya velum gill symbiont]OOY51793.1 hypothetical protein BOV94_04620 [Solemya velum gill symbiont]